MAQGKLYSILIALRDQMRTEIVGTGNYYYDLSDQQIISQFVELNDAQFFPMVCIASASENWTAQTIGSTGSTISLFKPSFEIEMFGYVKADSTENALPECLKLLSDIENAIFSDDQLSNTVVGLEVQSSVGSYERFGVLHMVVTGSY